jgi:hypothetical protein
MVLTPSTSSSGLILLPASTTTSFTQSAMGPTFSYGMPDFDSNLVLTYSTLQTMGLGVGSSNSPMQGSTRVASVPFNAIPYGGGHIPTPSPSLGGAFQPPIEPNVNYILYGGGSLGPLSYTMSVGSMFFSLFDMFGNNPFSSDATSAGGNPSFGQQNPVQSTIPSQGETTRVFSTQGLWNPWQGSVPLQGMSVGGNPFHAQWNPGQGSIPMPIGSAGGIPFQNNWNTMQGTTLAQAMSSNYKSQSMIPQ